MHATKVILAFASLAGYAAATSSWTVDKSCAAAYIAESCISTVSPQIDACGGNDWECLCTHYQTLLGSCYANCPNDPSISSVKTTILQYCSAYSATLSTSSTAAPSGTSTGSASSASSTSASSSTSTVNGESSSSSSTSSSPSGTSTAAAGAGFAVSPAHSYGALAGLLAVVGAFL